MSHNPPVLYPPAHSVTQTPSNFVHQPQIPQHARYYRPHVQDQLHYPPSTSNSTTAQSEYSHNFPAHSSRSRQAPRPNIVAVSQHQSTTQQNPPHQGKTSHQQDNRGPVPGQVNVQQATTQIVSAIKKHQPASISRPESSSGLSGTTSTGTVNYGMKVFPIPLTRNSPISNRNSLVESRWCTGWSYCTHNSIGVWPVFHFNRLLNSRPAGCSFCPAF